MDINFPNPPSYSSGQNENYYRPQQPVVAYDQFGNQIQAESYEPQRAPQVEPAHNTGVSFGNLIGKDVYVDANPMPIITDKGDTALKVKTKKKKSSDSGDDKDNAVVNSKEIVESTVYGDVYNNTNNMAYGIINQADEILANAKNEFDYIRTRQNMKGKYMYMTNMISSMSSLMATKLQAIKEINTNITKSNEMEYRRFKDNRALLQTDDNKMIMDAYSAFINTPVGANSTYSQPTTKELTMAVTGMIPADRVANDTSVVALTTSDPGLTSYLNNITPEENRMLNEGNPDIEEVIIYDQESGMKYFKWINLKTNQPVPNMPESSDILIEDYVIDPRTRTAKNTNLRDVKKVIYVNEDKFNNY